MRRALFAVLLTLGMAPDVWGDAIPQIMNASTQAGRTMTVYNDAGADLTSGTVVIWDNDDTEFDRTGYRYVTTTTAADNVWVAGVVSNPTCPSATLCEIVVEGPAMVRLADGTDGVAEDALVATTTVAGEAGDYTPAANTCALGRLTEDRNLDSGLANPGFDNAPMTVYVQISCQ